VELHGETMANPCYRRATLLRRRRDGKDANPDFVAKADRVAATKVLMRQMQRVLHLLGSPYVVARHAASGSGVAQIDRVSAGGRGIHPHQNPAIANLPLRTVEPVEFVILSKTQFKRLPLSRIGRVEVEIK